MKDHAIVDYSGDRYQATVPDTLDLADRAAIAINGLGGMIDPDLGHHMCFSVHYCSKHPYLSHSSMADYGCDPKFAESLPMMRLMSGSSQHMEIEAGQRAALLSRIAHRRRFVLGPPRSRPPLAAGPARKGQGRGSVPNVCSGANDSCPVELAGIG